jgi:hypothetical protein
VVLVVPFPYRDFSTRFNPHFEHEQEKTAGIYIATTSVGEINGSGVEVEINVDC